jgi:hypothetical protein
MGPIANLPAIPPQMETPDDVTTRNARAAADPFTLPGEWLRCALHTHTVETDGELRPSAHVQHHEWAGFDVVAITDHWRLTSQPSTNDILVITGAELGVDLPEEGRYCEVLAYGIKELPEDPGGRQKMWLEEYGYMFTTFPDLTTAATYINDQGGVSYLAHPYWSSIDPAVLLAAEGLAGLEVYNASSERDSGRGVSSVWWDAALEAGKTTYAIATDDSHYPLFDINHAWTWLRVSERTEEAVLHALRNGLAYSSAGPVLHDVHREGDAVEVRCSPCRSIVMVSQWETGASVVAGSRGRQWSGRILATDDELITHARLEAPWPPQYIRIVATDIRGHSAWTNPL